MHLIRRLPLKETTFTLMTSAGINSKTDSPFDVERERREPAWGDPTSRQIPSTATETDIDVNHLHINTDYIKQDINVMLPLARFREFEKEAIIGKLAPTCYSFYGFQLDPKDTLRSYHGCLAFGIDPDVYEVFRLVDSWLHKSYNHRWCLVCHVFSELPYRGI